MEIAAKAYSLIESAALSLMINELTRFLKNLNIEFVDKKLLRLALTHRSFGRKNYERLEFLGDAVLGYVISEKLFQMYPNVKEGDLSRLRASLVRKEALAELARDNGFPEVLQLGSGELKSGGSNRESMLADSFEALIGALLLDKNIDYVRQYLLRVYAARFASMPELDDLKDAKTKLQELLQSRKLDLPEYETLYEKTDHPQEFVVLCNIKALDLELEGKGSSKRKAEQAAARNVLDKIDGA